MSLKMEYNSQRESLIISEYGRSVQELVKYAKTIEDLKEKQRFFEEIVELINRMKVSGKRSIEYKEKIWRHLFKIADYEMEGIIMPNGEIPERKEETFRPPKVEYPSSEKRFRHYGHNIQLLIHKAIEMEDGPKKAEFIIIIATFMKLAYKTWNPEHYMNESMVRMDLETLSDGKLSVPKEARLDRNSGSGPQYRNKKKSYLTQTNPKAKKRRRRK